MVKAMGMLGNSKQRLLPLQKRLLYRSCVVPVATYGYRLWYFSNARCKGLLELLRKMQRVAAVWITGAFRTSPQVGIEAVAGLIPIHLHLTKLAQRSSNCILTLHANHALHSLTGLYMHCPQHNISFSNLTEARKAKVGGPLVEALALQPVPSERLEPLPKEGRPGDQLLDIHTNRFSYLQIDRKQENAVALQMTSLEELQKSSVSTPETALVVVSGSKRTGSQCISGAHMFHRGKRVFRLRVPTGLSSLSDCVLTGIRLGLSKALNITGILSINICLADISIASKLLCPT